MSDRRFVISSFCHGSGCVAVAAGVEGAAVVRDEKVRGGPELTFSAAEWSAFVAGVRNGELDLESLARQR